MIEFDKPRVSETEIIDIAIAYLFDGRPMSQCRGYLLSEYDLDACCPSVATHLLEGFQGTSSLSTQASSGMAGVPDSRGGLNGSMQHSTRSQ
jgi:hypothetical protein